MRIKSIVAAAGVVLLATLGAAQAGDSFDTLTGVVTTSMSRAELSDVRGANIVINTRPGVSDQNLSVALGLVLSVDTTGIPSCGGVVAVPSQLPLAPPTR